MTREREFHYQIPTCDHGLTAEEFLKKEGISRSLLSQLKQSPGGIRVEGRDVFSNQALKSGQILSIRLSEPVSSPSIAPVPMDLSILYEDEDLMVLNKPAGLAVQPSQGHRDDSLANGMAWYFEQKGEPFVYRVINRLDRDTSGLLILAKNRLAASLLSSMSAARQIRREYLAIACGLLPESGVITAAIARVPGSVLLRQTVETGGEYACTYYRRLAYDEASDCSLASVRLETGRTHQIRVHFSHIGHPLPGDFLYHPDYRYIKRQALHSWKLEFLHPIKKAPMAFLAPVPDDMKWVGFPTQEAT